KWHPDENLLKEDVSTIPVWVKLHGVPVTAFSEDGLSGRSSYTRAMIELRADVELKDNLVAVMPKITEEGYYTCNIRVEYEWKPHRCACCNPEECTKNTGAGATKNLKKTSQTPKGIPVGQKMGFKPKQVSKSNAFDVLNSVENDVDLDDDGNPLVPTDIVGSDSAVEVVFDKTANLRLSTSGKDGSDKCYGTNSLLEQWRDSYPDNDDYDPYDDDKYKNQFRGVHGAVRFGHRSNNYSESKRNDHLDNNRRQEQRNKGIPNKSHPNFREEHKSFSSIFVSNIPWNASVQDLWAICNKWGVVIDVYIAAKRSKSGHRFGFV
ncbi:copia protein, partial [Tanacetum coccineum]